MTLFFRFAALAVLALPLAVAAEDPVLEVEIGVQRLLRQSAAVERVAVGDPKIADVNVVARRDLLLTGKTLGLTSLLVWRAGAAPEAYRVRVVPALDGAQKKTDAELKDARVEQGRTLEGVLPNLLAHRRAKLAAQAQNKDVTDLSSVNLESQVMTEIKIAEVSRRTLQQFGLNLLKSTGNTLAGLGAPGAVTGIGYPAFPYTQPNFIPNGGQDGGVIANPNAGQPTGTFSVSGSQVPLANAFNLIAGNPARGLLGVLSILEGRGLARVLAEPSLVAMSGQTASFLAGGEFPVPVSQGGGNGGAVTIQYREFGVRLAITPTVLSRDRISLKVAPEVSDLDFSNGITVAGVSVPSLTVRRTDTTVELGDGESFVISGLVSSSLLTNVDKVPWLGDLPIIGAFFKSTRLSKQEKELVMVVTPRLVRPLSREAKLPPLPGAAYDRYDPNMAETLLLERGRFRQPTGFSR